LSDHEHSAVLHALIVHGEELAIERVDHEVLESGVECRGQRTTGPSRHGRALRRRAAA
jgi:hypothetical protein